MYCYASQNMISFFLPALRSEISLGSDSQSESLKSTHYDILHHGQHSLAKKLIFNLTSRAHESPRLEHIRNTVS